MIRYESGDGKILDCVGPLWERLREYHVAIAGRFAQEMATARFEDRSSAWKKKARKGRLRVDLVRDAVDGRCVGYCVTTFTKHKVGQVESIYVEPAFRRQGIGLTLMRRAMAWLDERGATSRIVSVLPGNNEAMGFYERLGFYPRTTILCQPGAAQD